MAPQGPGAGLPTAVWLGAEIPLQSIPSITKDVIVLYELWEDCVVIVGILYF